MRVLLSLLAVVVLGTAVSETPQTQEPEPSEFAISVFRDPGWEVLLAAEDIQKYELGSHTIHLTREALTRLKATSWWQNLDKRKAGGSFLVQVRGETIYAGNFRNPYLSSTAYPNGPYVPIPMLALDKLQYQQPVEKTYFSIRFYGEQNDPRADARILGALSRAGVLAE